VYYFKFEIPTNVNGTRVSYSLGWHGLMPKCPKDVTVLLYNDKEGYGIASTTDTFVPKEVTVLASKEVQNILALVKDEEQVYTTATMAKLWDVNVQVNKTLAVDATELTEGKVVFNGR
jgi:hypothetical protein